MMAGAGLRAGYASPRLYVALANTCSYVGGMHAPPTPEQRLNHARTKLLAIATGPWRDLRDAVAEAEQFLADTDHPKPPPAKRGHYRRP